VAFTSQINSWYYREIVCLAAPGDLLNEDEMYSKILAPKVQKSEREKIRFSHQISCGAAAPAFPRVFYPVKNLTEKNDFKKNNSRRNCLI
jgi:hypothetical protein